MIAGMIALTAQFLSIVVAFKILADRFPVPRWGMPIYKPRLRGSMLAGAVLLSWMQVFAQAHPEIGRASCRERV